MQIRSRTRQLRFDGLIRWHIRDIVASLPTIMHLALFLFFFGLVDLLVSTNKSVAWVVITFVAIGVVFYAVTATVPMFSIAAPFHSPVANMLQLLVTKFGGLFRKSPSKLTNLEAQSEEVAIENPADLLFGDFEPQARVARLERTLDVDSLTWLMKEVDKTIEGHLLDLCFQKLMEMRSITRNSPSTFYRKPIIQTYRQLVRNTMASLPNTIAAGGEPRAGLLCQFLSWFLSLQRTHEHELWLRKQLPESELRLPKAVFKIGLANQRTDDIVFARVAFCSLSHLHMRRSVSCSFCTNDPHVLDHFELKGKSPSPGSPNITAARLSYYLIALSTCVLFYGIQGNDTPLTEARMSALLNRTARILHHYMHAQPGNADALQPLEKFLRTQFPTHHLAAMWRQGILQVFERSQQLR